MLEFLDKHGSNDYIKQSWYLFSSKFRDSLYLSLYLNKIYPTSLEKSNAIRTAVDLHYIFFFIL